MNEFSEKDYYEMMLNTLSGLEDDLAANHAPKNAIDHLRKALDICLTDFRERFSTNQASHQLP